MKVLLFGSSGFIGRNVAASLEAGGHDVVNTYRNEEDGDGIVVDLLDQDGIRDVLETVRPDSVVNCAGIVQNNPAAYDNARHTENILRAAVASGLTIGRFVVMGSAAEYGVVETDGPVSEDTPLLASNDYGKSKVQEVERALELGQQHGLEVVVARVFNPIGAGMNPGMLIPKLLGQFKELEQGDRDGITLGRADSRRDYVAIRDVADAVTLLATGHTPRYGVYNVGSGKATSNRDLVELMARKLGLSEVPPIIESSDAPEPNFASRADISRLRDDYGWEPATALEETMQEIVDHAGNQ